jgi:hypothetical protein
MSVSKARRLLSEAAAEPRRLERHLMVAAALTEILSQEPIVVGGTAEEFHTAAEYHETDLDLVGWLAEGEDELLASLGFRKWGRHWFHEKAKVAVEFPESRLAGDLSRVVRRRVHGTDVALIGVDDLYLDRVRQATANDRESSIEFRSALAVAAATYDRIDWRYVSRHIGQARREDPPLGDHMRRIDSRIRRRVRRSLSQ